MIMMILVGLGPGTSSILHPYRKSRRVFLAKKNITTGSSCYFPLATRFKKLDARFLSSHTISICVESDSVKMVNLHQEILLTLGFLFRAPLGLPLPRRVSGSALVS